MPFVLLTPNPILASVNAARVFHSPAIVIGDLVLVVAG